jgi:hypothetical protein
MTVTPEALIELVIFLITQAGILIWILSNHAARLNAIEIFANARSDRGEANGRAVANLEGRFDESQKHTG